MAANSSIAGYLTPADPPPDYDAALEDIFQAVAVGLTGLAGALVRPRWQVVPANTPDVSVDWMAFGVTIQKAQWDAYQSHEQIIGGATNTVNRTERILVNFSFYGPHGQGYMARLRDGFAVTQNRDALDAKNIKLVEFSEPVNVPALLKDIWSRRVDLRTYFDRTAARVYPVLNLVSPSGSLSNSGTLDNERYTTPLLIPNP